MTREDKDAIIRRLEAMYGEAEDNETKEALFYAIEALKEQRPHGEWERVDKWVDGKYVGGFIHKECPMIKISDDCLYSPWTYNFCPNCGSDMRKVGEAE